MRLRFDGVKTLFVSRIYGHEASLDIIYSVRPITPFRPFPGPTGVTTTPKTQHLGLPLVDLGIWVLGYGTCGPQLTQTKTYYPHPMFFNLGPSGILPHIFISMISISSIITEFKFRVLNRCEEPYLWCSGNHHPPLVSCHKPKFDTHPTVTIGLKLKRKKKKRKRRRKIHSQINKLLGHRSRD